MAKGSVKDIKTNPKSLIGKFLTKEEDVIVRNRVESANIFKKGRISLATEPLHTVHSLNVAIPKNRLTTVTGVSGSGKTSAIAKVLLEFK